MRWQGHHGRQAWQVMRRRQARNEWERQRCQWIEAGRKHASQSSGGGRILLRLLQELFDVGVDFQLVSVMVIRTVFTRFAVVAGAAAVGAGTALIAGSGRLGLFRFAF